MAPIIPIVIALPLLGFWFWMLVDLVDNKHLTRNAKSYWFLAFVFLNVFAALWF